MNVATPDTLPTRFSARANPFVTDSVLSETRWLSPVTVKLQSGLTRRFSIVEEVLDFLANEWPIRRGLQLQRAMTLCQSAIAGEACLELARHAFIAACIEADMQPNSQVAA